MKKNITFFITLFTLLSLTAITSFAAETTAAASTASDFFTYLSQCPPVLAVLSISAVLIILTLIFRKKIAKKLNKSDASQMINAFIVFFSVFGIACFAMAIATDGVTWKHILNGTDDALDKYTHFSDYIKTLQNAGSQRFYKSAETQSPFSLLIFFILAQFMPANYIYSEAYLQYLSIIKNQTFIYLYLILVLFCIVLIYRMSRSQLRHNGLKMRDELVAFLMVVSYPTMYCISMGNITGVAVALCLYFLEFYNSERKLYRELAIVAIAISGAIVPYTFIFAVLLLKDRSKMSRLNFAQAAVFFITLFILPAAFTGFDNLATYLKSTFLIASDFIPGNSSIANLLRIFGAGDVVLYTVTIITEIIALICVFILPSTWQKTAAAVYFILNILTNANSLPTVFVVIPLVYLLKEKTHKATDWLYLLALSLLITPFPEWFYSYANEFNMMLESLGILGIQNANEIIAPVASQMIFVLIVCQAVSVIKNKRKQKKEASAQTV